MTRRLFRRGDRSRHRAPRPAPWQRLVREDRGDIPGWVMIVVMTAGLVILIWALAGEALTNVFNTAIDRILGA
ncbi:MULTISPECIES: hypothetical protein [unclassified Pseudactinotalea]|uniref:hypothetical protein n=1 Tax=unclassified Pseudactinotalea TaxID=2649176 RepID=UPI00128E5473|nr:MULTISPECIES: hypothetical protein [unclassified Pseudactinotalea]MPV49884.1 hypothetical protein [Pseudactinotalea sp. HY160]QGH69147.1 hypothetical protein GCE65_06220 [Pseudactinotalea sp. HY158]